MAVTALSLVVATLLPAAMAGPQCLSWTSGPPFEDKSPFETLRVNGHAICALVGSEDQAASCVTEGSCSLTDAANVGSVSSSETCHSGSHKEPVSRVLSVNPDCGTRWRFLTYDVWPIGSVIVAGQTELKHDYGICRCPNPEENEKGKFIVGRLHLAGPKMGGCVCLKPDDTEMFLIGEYEYLQADEGKGHLFDDVQSNSNAAIAISDDEIRPKVKDLIDTFLDAEDATLLANITGTPLSVLVHELLKEDGDFLRKVLSHERYIAHPTLNYLGLHLVRCLLAEKIADSRRRERGYHNHPDYETFMKDGILVKNFTNLSEQDIKEIMKMVSGMDESELPPLRWVDRPVKHMANDAQYELHVDTFHAAYKIWIYKQKTTVDQGPLNFVLGSHRNSPGKLRWLYKVTVPPASHVLKEPSIRLNEEEEKLGFEHRKIMTTPPMSFVIADTSAFHARGLAEPGTIRHAMRIEGPFDGGLPRKNPFL